jgi:hypothetical protein
MVDGGAMAGMGGMSMRGGGMTRRLGW